MNWYKIALLDQKPYGIWVDEGNGYKKIRMLENKIIWAKKESEAWARFLKDIPWLKNYIGAKRKAGDIVSLIVDREKLTRAENADKDEQERPNNNWDKKLERQQDMFGKMGI